MSGERADTVAKNSPVANDDIFREILRELREHRAEYADSALPSSLVTTDAVCREILKEVCQHRAETKSMREELDSLKTSVEARLGDCEMRLTTLEIKYSESQSSQHPACESMEVETLRSTVEQLKIELNNRDQEAFSNDIEITGIPEEQGGSAEHLVNIVATKLGISCDQQDVVFVQRMGSRRAPPSSAGAPRHRSLIVRLARKQTRDAFLQGARTRRPHLTTDGMGLAATATHTRIYINERLSKRNKMLFYKARELARSRGFKYVWVRDGQILLRCETGKRPFRVQTEEDLKKLFSEQ